MQLFTNVQMWLHIYCSQSPVYQAISGINYGAARAQAL